MMNPRPIGVRKTVQFMVLLTLLAWATHTLFQQWGFGALIMPDAPKTSSSATSVAPSITLELRTQINTVQGDVTLKDVCRWNEQDAPALKSVQNVVLVRFGDAKGVQRVSIEQIREALHKSGQNLSGVQFSGAATCVVVRGNVDASAVAGVMSNAANPASAELAKAQQIDAPPPQAFVVEEPKAPANVPPQTALKDLLVADLTDRLGLPADRLDVQFSPQEEATLKLTSPRATFVIDSAQAASLGKIEWTVSVKNDSGRRNVIIKANARAWQEQLITTRSLSKGQAVLANDVVEKRMLVDELQPEALTLRDDAIGQSAARDLKSGDALLPGDLKPRQIIAAGQFVTVAMTISGQNVQTVARALDAGAKGRTIRARNEANGDVYRVVITGPQSGSVAPAQDVASAGRE